MNGIGIWHLALSLELGCKSPVSFSYCAFSSLAYTYRMIAIFFSRSIARFINVSYRSINDNIIFLRDEIINAHRSIPESEKAVAKPEICKTATTWTEYNTVTRYESKA